MENICFTIGHSNRCKEEILKIFIRNEIKYLIDVRSIPYSKYSKQYNKEPFSKFLTNNGIHYKYLGNMLGGVVIGNNRSNTESIVLKDIKNGEKFRKGIEFVSNFIKQRKKIALMCSEKDPFLCHRFFLISSCLAKSGFEIIHIISEKNSIGNHVLEKKLKNIYNQKTLLNFQDSWNIEKFYEKHAITIYKKKFPDYDFK